MAEAARSRFPFSIKRWPVRWRLAGVSAGLTLILLVIFALVVGQLATDRIKDDFRQELLSVGSQVRTNIQFGHGAGDNITSPNFNQLALSGDAAARVVDGDGHIALDVVGRPMETLAAPDLGAPLPGVSR